LEKVRGDLIILKNAGKLAKDFGISEEELHLQGD